ncbi:hypothetical protein FRC17_010428, partial [Serendipita sp. 399]
MPAKGGNPEEIIRISLPPNAKILSFSNSDGLGPIRWPPLSQRSGPVRVDGRLNYFLPLPIDDKTPLTWRSRIGSKIAEMMGKPDADSYHLAGWPEGYEFFMHVTSRPDGTKRGDPYLYGSRHTHKFRSANEFLPHAYWLLTTTTMNKSECQCRYCGGHKLQSDVNQAVLGAPPRITTQSKPPKSGSSPEKAIKARPTTFPSNSSSAPTRPRNSTRIKEPRVIFPLDKRKEPPMSLYSSRTRFTNLHEGNDFRDGEIVLILLPDPIISDDGVPIKFWPSWVADVEYRKIVERDIAAASFSTKEELYLVTKPLCTEGTVVKVPASLVLPFRAWVISKELQDRLVRVPLPPNFADTVTIPVFDPNDCLGKLLPGITFDLVAPYFALAVQTASHMDIYWSPMLRIDTPSSSRYPGTNYQGLWYGIERIWLHDLVRLKISHADLLSHERLSNLHAVMEGSETRTLFMRIHQITVVETITQEGLIPVCQIRGPIFCTIPDSKYEYKQGNLMSPQESQAYGPLRDADGSVFPLPHPPPGFQFIPVTFDDQEVTLQVALLAGRYYPKLFFTQCLDMAGIRHNYPLWWKMETIRGSWIEPAQG